MSEGHQEIIIIKRHGDHEDGHHGGAWKIALADFMTAMMALFLVMWLINSTSKEQKQTIAEYFNPVKLAEVTHDRKGVNDPQDTPNDPAPSGKGKGDGGSAEGKADAAGAPGSRARESALFQDPYAVLDKLAAEAEAGPEAASADAAALEAGQPGVAGGETGRDVARTVDDPLGVALREERGVAWDRAARRDGDLRGRFGQARRGAHEPALLAAHEQPRVVAAHRRSSHEDRVALCPQLVDPVEVGGVGHRELVRRSAVEVAVERHRTAQGHIRPVDHDGSLPVTARG